MLTLFAPIGVILLMIGVVASTSGAFLAILSAILSVFMKTPDSVTTPANYADGKQVPEITIESTNYCENFDDNLCEQTSQQLSPKDLSNHTNDNNQDFIDKLDPVFWSNYPEAQNPKSYLNSFGDLPKIISSPEPSSQAGKSGKSGHKTFKDKYDDQIKRRISKTMKMGVKRKTISRTELTRDYSDDEITSSSSTSPSISPVNHKHSYYQMKANQCGPEPNESIITIENFHFNVNTTDDNNDSESASAVCSTPDVIFAHKSSADENTTEDNSDYTTTNHSNVSHKTDKTSSAQQFVDKYPRIK
ncbi:unnamed protein product [Medioppia subpectinata]|uniref:Uncharacterized protein n=1 Tax=Medioppia subpectinata TaxID=1979941 RepID=A0A7R9KSJ9_9ACAR|nr:unnamed protein product [Medioppia subpectinata]CAG2108623.1 unnamed protein product [Medioppia subpectinata]